MYKFLAVSILVIITSVFAFPQNSNDYNKNEFFVGGLVQRVNTEGSRIPINSESGFGFEASYVRNVSRYVGIKGDISRAFSNISLQTNVRSVPDYSLNTNEDRSVYNFLGGVQIKDNASKQRIAPFVHVLAGVGHIRANLSTTCLSGSCPSSTLNNDSFNSTGFSAALGSGLDIKIKDRIGVRVNVDYNPIYSRGSLNNNTRFSFGIVFK